MNQCIKCIPLLYHNYDLINLITQHISDLNVFQCTQVHTNYRFYHTKNSCLYGIVPCLHIHRVKLYNNNCFVNVFYIKIYFKECIITSDFLE